MTPQGAVAADVLVENGVIRSVGASLKAPGAQIIDAKGLTLIPGAIDPQVHFREPGMEWKEDLATGSRAAAAGGVTGFLEMPNTSPPTVTAELMEAKKKLAASKCLVNYNFFIGATPDNLPELLATRNVCGIKIFMGASTGSLLVDKLADQDRIFSQGRRLIAVHAEDEALIRENKARYGATTNVHEHALIRSPEVALRATRTAVELSRKYNRRLHILHMTTQEEAEFLAKSKAGLPVSAEVCPQHFLLNAPECYEKLGPYAQMNPPLREKRHGEALWHALKTGVIDCIATDHAPHTREEKDKGFPHSPSGMPGVETSLPLMLNRVNQGLCTLAEVVRWMCENPARLYGLKNKGRIQAGYDADLVLLDMGREKTIEDGKLQTKVNWSPYNGWKTKGWPVMTMVNGNIVFREGEFFTDILGREMIIDAPWENGGTFP
ncbi:MAG: dihydroorotase, multifunctional complex type [Fibrobacteres bacterium]|nr:dihydroorotase, multifunctional complex type [Fibrobacterota bacterium]